MGNTKSLMPLELVERAILVIRGQKVIIDADLARLYGVTTKRLNEQVRRNRDRFPEDFMFSLTDEEKAEVVANCDHLSKLKFSPVLPSAFTEHGAIMAASVLNTPRAIEASVPLVPKLRLGNPLDSGSSGFPPVGADWDCNRAINDSQRADFRAQV